MAIVCQHCGSHNPDGAQFCANDTCGLYLWSGRPSTTAVTAVVSGSPESTAQLNLTVENSDLTVEPGQTATTTVTVRNGGSQVEEFTVTVLGPAAAWADVQPVSVQVYPGRQGTCTIEFSPPRVSGTVPGRLRYLVRAASSLDRGRVAEAAGTLTVGEFRELSAAVAPRDSTGRGAVGQTVTVTNRGNVVETVQMRADDPSGRLRFGLPPGEITLPPGSRDTPIRVRPPRQIFARSRTYDYKLQVVPRPPGEPIELDSSRETVPLIAGWVPKVVAAVLAVALAGLAFWWTNRPDETDLKGVGDIDATEATPDESPEVESSEAEDDADEEPEPSEEPASGEAEESTEPAAPTEPELEHEDCVEYLPGQLVVDEFQGPTWAITDGPNLWENFGFEHEAEQAKQVAEHSDRQCYIGWDNTMEDEWHSFVVMYWLGDGLGEDAGEIPEADCVEYDPDHLEVVVDGLGWSLTDGENHLAILATPEDAEDAETVAGFYSKVCTIGATWSAENGWPVFRYWLP